MEVPLARIHLLSDLHLSPTHGFFWENWRIARDATNAAAPDLVIINGDLCINGPDSDAEMAFAARALRRLAPRSFALPGNHDVGDEPPGQDAKQLVDAARLARWHSHLGADHFAVDAGAWRLVGLNAQLFGSDLPQEAAQFAWLAAELAATTRPVALILHKPLFMGSPDETALTAASMNPAPRARLLALLHQGEVRLVISGHLHSHRDFMHDGIRYLWIPALAFLGSGFPGSVPMVAATELDLSQAEPRITLLHPAGLVAHDLAALKGHGRYQFLRDMPDCPPPAEEV